MQSEGFDDLIRRAQKGDRDALGELFAMVRPLLERRAERFADPAQASQSASDLVQETELRAWRKLEQFTAGAGDAESLARFQGWIVQILDRLGINRHHHRHAQKRRPATGAVVRLGRPGAAGGGDSAAAPPEPHGVDATPSARLHAEDESRLLRNAMLRHLDAVERDILRRHVIEGEPLTRVAEALALPYATVRRLYLESLGRLERELGGLLG